MFYLFEYKSNETLKHFFFLAEFLLSSLFIGPYEYPLDRMLIQGKQTKINYICRNTLKHKLKLSYSSKTN